MLAEKLLDSIIKERINNTLPSDGYYVLCIRRKHSINIIRNTYSMSMPIGVIRIEDDKYHFYIDNKTMTLPPKVETIDGKEVVSKPITLKWDMWSDAFLSLKAIDRVVNNRFTKRIPYIMRGIDRYTLSKLVRILRYNWDKYEFVYDELDDAVVNIIENNPHAKWNDLSEVDRYDKEIDKRYKKKI